MLSFEQWFSSRHATIPVTSAKAVLALAEGGATLPFIARYRKEQTGNLDEVAIQSVLDAKATWDAVEHRKTFVCEEIAKQGKLTPELKERILATYDLERLEDLYLPYKQKRKTKAMVAREAGLEPLAEWMWRVSHEDGAEKASLEETARAFVSAEKNVATVEQAVEGARDIVIERLSEDADLRERVRRALFDQGFVRSKKGDKAKPNSKVERYFAHHERVSVLMQPEASHRYLAMRRGFMEEELVLSIGGAPDDEAFDAALLAAFERAACPRASSPAAEVMKKAARLSLRAHVQPSIENEVNRALRESADAAAIHVFAENLRKLLLASPYGAKSVLGVDPGIRTGCKLAVVSDSGAYLGSHVIHLGSDRERASAKEVLRLAVTNGNVTAVAVGNGTAGRETEAFIRSALGELGLGKVPVVMVSEAGASVYSASEVAREEFPDLDLTIRGAISIARRLQDPLAELVKVDPKSIGVGQYQHDVSPVALKRSLETVVKSCVNSVGINVNTASPYLLAEVAGIGASLARGVVEHRAKKGVFKAKRDLLAVAALLGEGLRAGRRLPAHPGRRSPARRHRDPPRAVRAARDARRAVGEEGGRSRRRRRHDGESGPPVPVRGGPVHLRRHRQGARAARARSARVVRRVELPGRHSPARGPEARHELPGDRDERHQLRRLRRHRRPPGRPRARLAARRPLREGSARRREPRRSRDGARPRGEPREEADRAHDEERRRRRQRERRAEA